jgi:hypothetical protein
MPAKPRPLGLSDSQFSQLINCAEQLHPKDRDAFLRTIAQRFDGRGGDIGDGEFGRALRELLRGDRFKPPLQTAAKHQPDFTRPSKLANGPPIA